MWRHVIGQGALEEGAAGEARKVNAARGEKALGSDTSILYSNSRKDLVLMNDSLENLLGSGREEGERRRLS